MKNVHELFKKNALFFSNEPFKQSGEWVHIFQRSLIGKEKLNGLPINVFAAFSLWVMDVSHAISVSLWFVKKGYQQREGGRDGNEEERDLFRVDEMSSGVAVV